MFQLSFLIGAVYRVIAYFGLRFIKRSRQQYTWTQQTKRRVDAGDPIRREDIDVLRNLITRDDDK